MGSHYSAACRDLLESLENPEFLQELEAIQGRRQVLDTYQEPTLLFLSNKRTSGSQAFKKAESVFQVPQ